MTAIQGMMYSVLFISSDTEPSDWPSDKIEISSGSSRIFVLSVKLCPFYWSIRRYPIFHVNRVRIIMFFFFGANLRIARAFCIFKCDFLSQTYIYFLLLSYTVIRFLLCPYTEIKSHIWLFAFHSLARA